ncbi:hypothetical protein N7532_003494 [Penicillium argentinense]|uniref:Transposase MuDR plant domain-containing protein n=1 Tax=Penicillium argentinense TaxID=1131581 RepID=A0A9W9FN42_9EURO|nr:uncharacterized protein N7532_003494 [Penicillium argentinense]KAJ5102965.1 hypothetical protein N7532_003494 [Penicillium argentinense]
MTEMYSGLHVGQRFSSLDDFKTVIRSISVRQHWELRVMRSNKKSVVIGCRSGSNCFFRVVCRANKNATYITSLQDSHTCRRSAETPAATPARSEASHVRFLLTEIPKLFDMKGKITGQDVVDAVKRYHGYDISMRQAQRALIKLQPRRTDSQGDQSLDLDMSAGDQQSPTQSQPSSQGDAGPAFRAMSENRWISDPLPPTLMDEEAMNPAESPRNHGPVPPPPPAQVRPTQIPQPPPIGTSSQSSLNTDPRPMAGSQAGLGYPTGPALSVAGPEHPKPPNYPQRNDHPVPAQMLLTNFKIEFTCTTCGSLNQSFFPNQGNVTGGSYMGHQHVPTQSPVARHPGPAPPGPDGNGTEVPEDNAYTVNALNARVMQNAWATGGLGVPIGPPNT